MIHPDSNAMFIQLKSFDPNADYWILQMDAKEGVVQLGCGLDDLERIHAVVRSLLQKRALEKARSE